MKILELLSEQAAKQAKSFLICGGHAASYLGEQRFTADLDLLVNAEDLPFWRSIAEGVGYQCYHERGATLQFSPPLTSMMPLDFIGVDPESFNALLAAALDAEILGVDCKLPSHRHLIAMKLHALKENFEERKFKDIPDIRSLAEACGMELRGEEFSELNKQYGSQEIYDEVIR